MNVIVYQVSYRLFSSKWKQSTFLFSKLTKFCMCLRTEAYQWGLCLSTVDFVTVRCFPMKKAEKVVF